MPNNRLNLRGGQTCVIICITKTSDMIRMNFFHEDGRGGIVDESGKEVSTFIVDPSFR